MLIENVHKVQKVHEDETVSIPCLRDITPLYLKSLVKVQSVLQYLQEEDVTSGYI